ncbi:hypothetical protein CQW23_08514 [Capsicum baccatum]|uniref:Uncharacterized protein n=1 Tax=Capsicum baccatum TaxID=33114 RepID=A0A2G2X954_CAPBA|nr:hypothetical protein CQW23_08514 [Capsicum baccatum]
MRWWGATAHRWVDSPLNLSSDWDRIGTYCLSVTVGCDGPSLVRWSQTSPSYLSRELAHCHDVTVMVDDPSLVRRYCLDKVTYDEFVHRVCEDCKNKVPNEVTVRKSDAIPLEKCTDYDPVWRRAPDLSFHHPVFRRVPDLLFRHPVFQAGS